jgi:hypothetical protein
MPLGFFFWNPWVALNQIWASLSDLGLIASANFCVGLGWFASAMLVLEIGRGSLVAQWLVLSWAGLAWLVAPNKSLQSGTAWRARYSGLLIFSLPRQRPSAIMLPLNLWAALVGIHPAAPELKR